MIALLLADGFEEIEAITVVDVLRRADIDISLVSIGENKCITGCHNIKIQADLTLNELEKEKLSMLVLPGGMPGTTNLLNSKAVDSCLAYCLANDVKLAAICAAPIVLAKAECLKNIKATCFPGFENKMFGANLVNTACITDKNITTANGPGAAMVFALEILSIFRGKEFADEISKQMQNNL